MLKRNFEDNHNLFARFFRITFQGSALSNFLFSRHKGLYDHRCCYNKLYHNVSLHLESHMFSNCFRQRALFHLPNKRQQPLINSTVYRPLSVKRLYKYAVTLNRRCHFAVIWGSEAFHWKQW